MVIFNSYVSLPEGTPGCPMFQADKTWVLAWLTKAISPPDMLVEGGATASFGEMPRYKISCYSVVVFLGLQIGPHHRNYSNIMMTLEDVR